MTDPWLPFPNGYAGWFGHAVMRKEGDRLIVVCIDGEPDTESPDIREYWSDAMQRVCGDCSVRSRILYDRSGRAILGIVHS